MISRTGFFVLLAMASSQFAIAQDSTTPQGSSWNVDEQSNDGAAAVRQPASPPIEDVPGEAPVDPQDLQDLGYLLGETYRLSVGDTISISVYGETDLNMSATRIPASGEIDFPLIGSIVAEDRTAIDLEMEVTERLGQGFVRNPSVNVTINSFRPFYVRGEVASPGFYTYNDRLTVGRAIIIAGGPSVSSSAASVSLLRDGEVVYDDLSVESEQAILPGDVISIQEERGVVAEDASDYIYLTGEVRSPGGYDFRNGLTVEKAVVLAGGFGPRASKRKITISREVEGSDEIQVIKKAGLYEKLMPGDVITIGASWF